MKSKIKKIFKEFYVALAFICLVVLVLNYNFFAEQIKFVLNLKSGNQSKELAVITEPNKLVIARLNILAPIVYVNENSEKTFQDALANGVVHYPGTASPGESGNAYFFGHSSDFLWSKGKFKTIFAALPKIQINDRIQISDSQGREYNYFVSGTAIVSNDDLSVLDQGDRTQKLLTLQTSYPVGTALKRFIVRAVLHGPIRR